MSSNLPPYTGLHGLEPQPREHDYLTERVEAEWFFEWIDGTPEPAKSVLATSATRLGGGGIATSMANDPVSYWSKALGFERPVTRETIAEIVDFYLASGTPSATIQIAPDLVPADWDQICAEFGLSTDHSWVKLAGSSDIRLDLPVGVRVGVVGPDDVDEWANVVFRGFQMPTDHLPSIAVESALRGAIQPFAAWVGSTLVAGASLAVVDGIGALLGAATLSEYRGRGAQRALIGIRAQSARSQGVDRLVAEAVRPGVERGNPSLNNLQLAGLRPVYERANWQWTNPAFA
jgi:ribosomal protein S18 acetylase RimI-like enzyme